MIRERAVTFGERHHLVGVLSDPPADTTRREAAPAVVLLNAGLLHKVGACRLHVQLARALAPLGFPVLRFDFSGIGDSDSSPDGVAFEQAAIAETRQAMDLVARTYGSQQFVLMGLCSGADMAFETAKIDARVTGILQIDPYAYRTWRYFLHRYGPHLLDLPRWVRAANRLVRRTAGRVAQREPDERAEIVSPYARIFPPQEYVRDGLAALAARGVHQYAVFTAGQQDHYNYARQHEDVFKTVDFRGRLRVLFLPNADHILTRPPDQRAVVASAAEWLQAIAREQTTSELVSHSA